MEKLICSLSLGLCLLAATDALAAPRGTLLLRGATVHTVTKGVLPATDVLVRDGRIAAVGPALADTADRVVDLNGLHLFPGLISAATDLGLVEIPGVRASVDDRETGDYAPEVEAWMAVNPDSELIPVARANGITHFAPVPQGKLLTGSSALLATRGWTIEEMTLRKRTAMHLVWPDMSLSIPSPQNSKTPPLEDQARERREKVRALDEFFANAEAWGRRVEGAPMVPAWQAMQPVLDGRLPLTLHAQSLRQLRSVVEWAEKHPKIKVTVLGGRDAWKVAADLARLKIPVIYTEVFELPGQGSDAYDVQFRVPAVLHQAGVTVAISEGLDRASASGQRNLPYIAAQAAAFGLPPEAALAAITQVPAMLHGVGDSLGSIEVGKEASLFAATGDILDIRSVVKQLWIAGEEQSLESRHTRLAERYRARPRAR